MKLFLVFIFLFASQVSLANEYYQEYGSCRITASEQDLYNPELPLPFHLKIDFVLSFDSSNHQFKGQKMVIRPEVNATTPVSTSDLAPIEDSIKIERFNNGEYIYSFAIKDQKLLRSILQYTGSYRVKDNHDLPVFSSGNRHMNEVIRVQSHLPPDIEDGLSFHIQLDCNVFNSRPRISTDNTFPPLQKPNEDILTKESWCQNGWVVYSPTKNTRTCEWRPF